MSATAEKIPTELAVLPPREKAMDVYTATNGLDPYMKRVREQIDAFSADVTTNKGRKAIASMASKVARCKTAWDGLGKDLVTELKEKPKMIDAERKRMRDLMDSWRDEVRQPLNKWEEAEQARVDGHRAAIKHFEAMQFCSDLDSSEIRRSIQLTESVRIGDHWEEFEAEAARTKDATLAKLREQLVIREKYEAEQAELELLRKQAAEREIADREARIAREAKEQAEAEAKARMEAQVQAMKDAEQARIRHNEEEQRRIDAEAKRREQAHADALAASERAKAEAEQRAIDAAIRERARIEAEQASQKAAAEKQAANKAHRKAINNAALEDLMAAGLVDEETAKFIIALIATNKIRHTTINY